MTTLIASFGVGFALGFGVGGWWVLRFSIHHWNEYVKFSKNLRDKAAANDKRMAKAKGETP